MSKALSVGIDTSCYTTSVACVEDKSIVFSDKTMLSVPFGGRGLRQSEGLYQHIRGIAPLVERLFQNVDRERIACVSVSAAPTMQEGSFMPVFLAGGTVARSLAAALSVPCIETDHQSGHIRAALHTNEVLLERERFLALHISGGTTDLLLVEPCLRMPYRITPIGRSTDLHAGQFVDRVGVALGCSFPSGKELETLALRAERKEIKLASSVRGTDCSLSGAESAAARLVGTVDASEIAYGVYDCLARTVAKMIASASEQFGELPVLLCGGVASSPLLRTMLRTRTKADLYFGQSALSSDNAVGTAFLGLERRQGWSN